MGRLTLRHLYLLLGEWVYGQRLEEERAYKIVCSTSGKAPELKHFPFLVNAASEETVDADDLLEGALAENVPDDAFVMDSIAASLGE